MNDNLLIRKLQIGNAAIPNNIFLAPMAGVTDLPFRMLCKEQGCGMVYTEMISAKGVFFDNANTKSLLQASAEEHPLGVQMFGREPEILAEMAQKMSDYPVELIDINMGCPAPKIVKNGEGSALMKEPELVGKIVKAVAAATDKPVTVKIRKGFGGSANAVEIAKIAEENGAAAITVHGRTREQYYSGKADWGIIAEVVKAVSIPVIGNGDIMCAEDAARMLKETGCAAVMVGRGSQGNPWIFREIRRYLQTGEILEKPCAEEKIRMALRHGKLLMDYKGDYIGVREMRKHLAWYTKGIKDSAKLRTEINKAETYEEIEKIMSRLL